MSSVLFANAAVIVILGHYGSGKTNFALNLARDLRPRVKHLTVIDLDVVNPYFRTTDNASILSGLDIEVLGPSYGASNLDTPSLQPGIDSKIIDASRDNPVILDVGGDPDGAKALARYSPSLARAGELAVVAIVNQARPETQTVEQNIQILRQIETVAKLKFTALIGNTHLKEFTSVQTILEQIPVLEELAEQLDLPIAGITVPRQIAAQVEQEIALFSPKNTPCLYAIEQIVKTVWE